MLLIYEMSVGYVVVNVQRCSSLHVYVTFAHLLYLLITCSPRLYTWLERWWRHFSYWYHWLWPAKT